MEEKRGIAVQHDGEITIAVGKSRKETKWKNRSFKWSELLSKLQRTIYTHESFEEYKKLSKSEQDDIKDVGGFVGGSLKSEKRRRGTVADRCLLTLDADFGFTGLWDLIEVLFDFSCCIYSTHKHSPEKPRLRLVIPLNRNISPEEYQAVARMVAADIGIEYFDPTTFEPSRLMYWPSTSSDGVYEFNYQDGKWLNPDEVLKRYDNWRDVSSWPDSLRDKVVREKLYKNQGNPCEKSGLIGAFCRSYSVYDAIEKFLSDIYSPCSESSRYTYTKGSTSGGLVVYEEGNFAFSHHGSDPAGGRLLNAFDLVRIHRFGHLDEDAGEDVQFSKLPSFKEMIALCIKDERVRISLGEERLKSARESFNPGEEADAADTEWLRLIEVDKNGLLKSSIENIILILQNDPYFKGRIAHNEFSHRTMAKGDLPWRRLSKLEDEWKDSDDSALRHYIESVYGLSTPNKIYDGVSVVEHQNSYHPVREYLENLVWDGKKRIDTLLIDYLGAEDTSYTRTVTRKSITAAVARVFEPGIKFDYMLVLVGKQGLGKSHILSLLGGEWYSDSINTVLGKEAYEQLQMGWLIEMAELSATRRAEAEAVKHFISKREDIYREAYGRRTAKFPRQCVFFGTTNDNEFLKDKTGNRRFWPVVVGILKNSKNLWRDFVKSEIDQVWAEAVQLYRKGESLFLEGDDAEEALKKQDLHTEQNSKEGPIREYLNLLLPENWSSMDIGGRRRYIHGTEFGTAQDGTLRRDRVCAMEIWVELFEGDQKQFTPAMSKEINDVIRRIEGWEAYSKGTGKLKFGKIYGLQRAFVREGYREN